MTGRSSTSFLKPGRPALRETQRLSSLGRRSSVARSRKSSGCMLVSYPSSAPHNSRHGSLVDFVPTGGKLSALAYATVSLFDVDRHWSIGPRQERVDLCHVFPGRHTRLRDMLPSSDEPTRERFWRLSEVMANANDPSLVEALLARPSNDTATEIAVLADQLARHDSRDGGAPLRITNEGRRELTTLLVRRVEVLLASPDADSKAFADVARAVGRVASPELTSPLRRLLDEDLGRWRASREAQSAGLAGHALERSQAHATWTLQYRNAFAAIGDDTVA